ncbi:MAG: accessory Sec system glycosyltransferase GtfA, partial [Lachnospiraceae bacterium]|nr:accessory Sec system glycosyltransferase GtfA [Lachnospiraceae bacterium]
MIYNFNLGIGWASSGVEYAQSYRANILRKIDKQFKFVFTDMFVRDNIEHMTENIGFKDTEVIWLYQYFTDFRTAPVTYTLKDLEKDFEAKEYTFTREGKTARYIFPGKDNFYTVYLVDEESDLVHRVERVSMGFLVRKDFYTYGRVFTEYYAPKDKKAHLYLRRFFNTNGSVAFEEVIDDDSVLYRMKDTVLYSKEELVGYMVRSLGLTERDIVIIDRTTGIGQAILQNAASAKVGIVIHADHFSENNTNEDNILWNNFYEYSFSQHEHIDFYVTATDAQNVLLREQFREYKGVEPNIVTVPVGSVDELKVPKKKRKKHSLITASRLANEKHVDWLIRAVVKAREQIPDVSLDIYGKGACEKDLKSAIEEYDAGEYVRLMGQHDLTDVYIGYDAYLSG